MHTTFQINWLRETGSGHLEVDLGTTVIAPQLELAIIGLLPEQQPGKIWGGVNYAELRTPRMLPEWARSRVQHFFGGDPKTHQLTLIEGLCNRIRDKACDLDHASLFLPYFSRREWIEKFSILAQIEFDLTLDGVVAQGMRPQSLREILLRTAAGVLTTSPANSPLRFETSIPVIDPWRTLLLDRYGLELAGNPSALTQFTMDSSGRELTAWPNTPRERHSHYYAVFSRMAMAIQYSLRRWTLATFAVGPQALSDFDQGADVLAYSAIRPHAEKRARDFSYDVLNADMMDFAFGRAARRLEPMLRMARETLVTGGWPDEARQYLRRDIRLHALRLAARSRRRSRVRQMLVSEGVLIYSMIKFSNRLKSLDSARSVITAVDELNQDFDDRIHRLFFFLDQPQDFGTMVFLEASNAIFCAMGASRGCNFSAKQRTVRSIAPPAPSLIAWPPSKSVTSPGFLRHPLRPDSSDGSPLRPHTPRAGSYCPCRSQTAPEPATARL